jgi:hypothetical protein
MTTSHGHNYSYFSNYDSVSLLELYLSKVVFGSATSDSGHDTSDVTSHDSGRHLGGGGSAASSSHSEQSDEISYTDAYIGPP